MSLSFVPIKQQQIAIDYIRSPLGELHVVQHGVRAELTPSTTWGLFDPQPHASPAGGEIRGKQDPAHGAMWNGPTKGKLHGREIP
jgi:hypothetical protein